MAPGEEVSTGLRSDVTSPSALGSFDDHFLCCKSGSVDVLVSVAQKPSQLVAAFTYAIFDSLIEKEPSTLSFGVALC